MVLRKPLVSISGFTSELPPGDTIEGVVLSATLTAGSGLLGGGSLSSNQRIDVGLASNPSGLILVGNNLGLDGVAQRTSDTALASGNAALSSAATAQASGNAALSSAATAQASGNAALSSAATAQASGNAALSSAATALASGNAALTSASLKLPLTGGILTGDLTLDNQSDLRFREATAGGTNYVGFQAPSSISSDLLWTLPGSDGSSGQVIQTNGGGVLSFATPSAGKVVKTAYSSSGSYQYTLSTSFQPGPVSAAITPTSSSNYILVMISSAYYYVYEAALYRNGSYLVQSKGTAGINTVTDQFTFIYYDYPGGTSNYSYQMYFRSNGSSYAYLGYDTTSTISLMEVTVP